MTSGVVARYCTEAIAADVDGYETIIRRSDFKGEKAWSGEGCSSRVRMLLRDGGVKSAEERRFWMDESIGKNDCDLRRSDLR